jgi:hypothetical protein
VQRRWFRRGLQSWLGAPGLAVTVSDVGLDDRNQGFFAAADTSQQGQGCCALTAQSNGVEVGASREARSAGKDFNEEVTSVKDSGAEDNQIKEGNGDRPDSTASTTQKAGFDSGRFSACKAPITDMDIGEQILDSDGPDSGKHEDAQGLWSNVGTAGSAEKKN